MSIKHAPDVAEFHKPRLPQVVADTSNSTSFATTESTIFSQTQRGSQDGLSPATTVSFHTSQDYFSSPHWTETMLEKAEAGVQSMKVATPPVSRLLSFDGTNGVRSQQDSDYGTPPRSSMFSAVFSQSGDQPSCFSASSPGKISKLKRVKNSVADGLTRIRLPNTISELPLGICLEAFRVITNCGISPAELDARWPLKDLESLRAIALRLNSEFHCGFETSFDGHSLYARLRFNPARGQADSIFKLEGLPPQKQEPNAYQRRFGGDRFLFVEIEWPFEPPKGLDLNDYAEQIHTQFLEMLNTDQEFLGRTWRHLLVLHKNRKKPGEVGTAGIVQLVFFAVSGPGLQPLGLRAPLNWALPLKANAKKTLRKACSRLDLRASRPLFTLAKSRSDYELVDDLHGTNEDDVCRFNDPDPRHNFCEEYKNDTVMSDGCGEADESIFIEIRNHLKIDYLPCCVQFRGYGCKGMLSMRAPEAVDDDTDLHGTLNTRKPAITVRRSQSKVIIPEDIDDLETFELNIVSICGPLTQSYLYDDFLPIMVDRHVPQQAIENYAKVQIARDMGDFLEALKSPSELRRWINLQNAGAENLRRETEIETVAGFPKALTEKAVQMLESGFDAVKFEPLAKMIETISGSYFQDLRKSFKIKVGKSTMARAIADPTGTLAPGEIQLNFSRQFEDPDTEEGWQHLRGPVLVSRNPAARDSDMQKVRAVVRPELTHLYDCVVFSSRGRRPLADKCSGGDYDGDLFWLCWEQSFVKPFLNAPAPASLPSPSAFDIEVEESLLEDVATNPESEEQAKELVRLTTKGRLQSNKLGFVTKTRDKVVYRENSLASPIVKDLNDLKDLIMDSDKNGRFFSAAAWEKFKKDRKIRNLPNPPYTNKSLDDESMPHNVDNILDSVHCSIVRPAITDAKAKMVRILGDATIHDTDLCKRYNDLEAEFARKPWIRKELECLRTKLEYLKAEWATQTVGINTPSRFKVKDISYDSAKILSRCKFDAVQPENPTHDGVGEWLRSGGSNAPTTWDLIKASTLAKYCSGGMYWHGIAGRELCFLKIEASEEPFRTLQGASYRMLKYRKRKRAIEDVSGDDTLERVDTGSPARPSGGDGESD